MYTNENPKCNPKRPIWRVHSLEGDISNAILSLGIPPHLKGYQYIRDALLLFFEDSSSLQGVTKNLYPTIAKNHYTTPTRVERAIRHAIEISWSYGDRGCLRAYFPNLTEKPTTKEFLAFMFSWVSMFPFAG